MYFHVNLNFSKFVVAFRNFAKVYKNRKFGVMTRWLFGRSGFRISTGTKDFSRLHTVQTVFIAYHSIENWVLSRG